MESNSFKASSQTLDQVSLGSNRLKLKPYELSTDLKFIYR